MSIVRRSLFTALWVLALAACGTRAAAAQTVTADLNGDGIGDRIEAAPTGTELLVHTSARHRPQRLRAHDRIVRVVVTDINRDGNVDIVVTTRESGIRIWLNSGRGRFRSAARTASPTPDWRPAPGADSAPESAANDDGADAAGAGPVVTARERAPTLEPVFQPYLDATLPTTSRHARPRISRGPPHVAALT